MTVSELKEALSNFNNEDEINIVEALENPFETRRRSITSVFAIQDTDKDEYYNTTGVYFRLED